MWRNNLWKVRVKRRGRCCGIVWSEATHAECDCIWLSPPQRAPHALKAEGFHQCPAANWAGTASLTSLVSRQLPRRSTEEWRREEHHVDWKFTRKMTSWVNPTPVGCQLVIFVGDGWCTAEQTSTGFFYQHYHLLFFFKDILATHCNHIVSETALSVHFTTRNAYMIITYHHQKEANFEQVLDQKRRHAKGNFF